MKKWFALLLAVVMVLCCLTACGGKEETEPTEPPEEKIEWMPYGLTFGMTYAEAKAANSEMPEISLQENGSYFSKRQGVEAEFIKGYYGVPANEDERLFWLMRAPAFFYNYNQDKELYEFYAMITAFDADDAEVVHSHLKSYYTDLIKTEATVTEYSDATVAKWEKDGVTVELAKEEDRISVIVHDSNNDLDANK